MALCEASSALIGPCSSEGRWVGPDGKKRCSMHHVAAFGYQERLVRGGDVAEITKSELASAQLRGSQEDYQVFLHALAADGSLDVVDDPEQPEPEPVLDSEGNEVEDSEGNVVLQAPEPVLVSPVVQITVEADEEAAAAAEAEAEEEAAEAEKAAAEEEKEAKKATRASRIAEAEKA